MHLRTKLALLVVMVMALLPTAGTAYACDGSHNDTGGVAAASYSMHHRHGLGLLRASAGYLGLTVDQLKTQLMAGRTLAQVANAKSGKSAAGLVDYLTGLVKAKLDPFVTKGKLTSAQESAILARVQDKLTKLINVSWSSHQRGDWHH